MKLPISEIRTDGGTQPRAQLDGVTVSEYAEAMERGDDFPPVRVMHDGDNYWLYDGFHRVKAAQNIGRTDIEAEVEQGTKEDAQWASLAANKKHGLRRSQADKRRAIKRALRGWGEKKPDTEIAEHVGVHRHTVRKYAKELDSSCTNYTRSNEREVTRDGTTYTQDTSNIGASSGSRPSTGDGSPSSTSDTPTPPSPPGPGTEQEDEPITTGAPDRRRRRDLRERDSDYEPIKVEGEEEDEPPSTEDVTRRVVKALAKIRESEGAQLLLDFADEQHQFTSEQRKEVQETAENLIDFLQQATDSIKP